MAERKRDQFGRFAGKRSLPAPKRDSKGRFVAGEFRGKKFFRLKAPVDEEERLLAFTITARTKYRNGPKATPEITVSGVANEIQIKHLQAAMVDYLREFIRGGPQGPVVVGEVDSQLAPRNARMGLTEVAMYRENRRLDHHERDFKMNMTRRGF